LKPTKPNLREVPSGLYAILTSVRAEYFKDEEEVDAAFFEAWPVKCFRNASGVKYGGRFLIIRRDIAGLVPRLGVAVRVRGRGNTKKKLWEKTPEEWEDSDRRLSVRSSHTYSQGLLSAMASAEEVQENNPRGIPKAPFIVSLTDGLQSRAIG